MSSFRCLSRITIFNRLMNSKSSSVCARRFLLSSAYPCNSSWETVRENTALKDLDVYDFIMELRRQAQRGNAISAVDVDVALSCVADVEQFDEALNILYKFRHGVNAVDMLPSTHSAFIRSCLRYGKDETLLRVLDDPINYGVFPDAHDANTLMDHFLMNGNHRDAAKIATKIMLQEEFENKLTCWLAVLSCLKWIKEPVPDAVTAAEDTSKEGDDEEIVFRLPFLKNPHYDDHFDLTDLSALVGKTLVWISRHLDSQEVSSNLCALGHGVKKDHKQLAVSLKHQLASKIRLYEEVEQRLTSSNQNSGTGGSDEKTDDSPKEPVEDTESQQELEEIKAIVEQFRQSDLIIQGDLEESVLEELKKIQPDLEEHDIKYRTASLQEWDKGRQQRIENQVLRYLKTERLKEIETMRQEMKDTEEYLNFFENRTKLEISVHPELLRQEDEALEKAQAEKQQLPSDDKYVIPELKVRREVDKVEF